MPHTSPAQIGYLAGILDGEGYISLKPSRGGSGMIIRVGVNMTDLDVLERCQEIAGAGVIAGPRIRGTNKPIWIWNINHQRDAVAVLMTVYPLVGARRKRRIEEALAAWKAKPQRKKPEPWGIAGNNGCGTYAGWATHHRRGSPICAACRDAANEYRRARRKRPAR